MAIKHIFQNPFVLVAQGFVAGAILFFTTASQEPAAPDQAAQVVAAAKNLEA